MNEISKKDLEILKQIAYEVNHGIFYIDYKNINNVKLPFEFKIKEDDDLKEVIKEITKIIKNKEV